MYEYDTLDSSKLTETLKKNDECVVTLTKQKGKRCISLLEKLNKTINYDKASYSLLSRFIFLVSGLFEILKTLLVNAKLFEVLLFYYENGPSFEVEESINGDLIFRFKGK